MTRTVLALTLLAAACVDNLEPELTEVALESRLAPGPPDPCERTPRGRYGSCCAALENGCELPDECGPIGASGCVRYYCGPTPADWPMVCFAAE